MTIIMLEFYMTGSRAVPRPSTAPGMGVYSSRPEGLYDKSVSWIPNTDEIEKLVKKKLINQTPLC